MNQVAPDQDSTAAPAQLLAQTRSAGLRRRAVRAFAMVVAAAFIIDSAPSSWTWLAKPKQAVSVVINRVGLWQGQWSMFAPDPVLNNGWFTAEIQHTDGSQSQWNSPYWIEADSSDKFLRFRYLNYFNRLTNLWYDAARDDLADHLARRSAAPVESIKLYHAQMRLIMPDDGTLPKRDEAAWMFSSKLVAKRTYSPIRLSPSNSFPNSSPQSNSPQNSSQQNNSQSSSVKNSPQLDSQQ